MNLRLRPSFALREASCGPSPATLSLSGSGIDRAAQLNSRPRAKGGVVVRLPRLPLMARERIGRATSKATASGLCGRGWEASGWAGKSDGDGALWRLADIADRHIDGDFLAVTQQGQLYRVTDSYLLELIGQI
jgi:hypothetical protein